MPTTQDPNQSLEAIIDRFIVDTSLAHDFVKGDETLDVVGSEGTYPSLAKIAKQARDLISNTQIAVQTMMQDLGGMKVMKFEFETGIQIILPHNAKTQFYTLKMVNHLGQELQLVPNGPVDDDNIIVEFSEPESGVAIIQLFTAL